MTVLSDKRLKEYLFRRKLVVHPILSLDQIKGSRIDLRLSNIIYRIKHFERPAFDPKKATPDVEYGEEHNIQFDKGVVLQIGDFAIAPLFERIRLPDDLVARLDGRSSLGRLGIIVHATAGGIDPGFSGQLTCELSNLGKVPVVLYPLMRVASLTVEEMTEKSDMPYYARKGQFDKKYGKELGTSLQSDYEFAMKVLNKVQENI
jgi:dCTP deaminase